MVTRKFEEFSTQTTACGREDFFCSSLDFGREISVVKTFKETCLLLRSDNMVTPSYVAPGLGINTQKSKEIIVIFNSSPKSKEIIDFDGSLKK